MPDTHPPARSNGGNSRHVLLVDDDADLRLLTHALLSEEGYNVSSCSNGLRALEIAHRFPSFDLLLTDFQMPFLSGLELAEACIRRQPNLPVIIISGADMTDEHLATIRTHGWRFLPKPFRIPGLLNLVHEAVSPTGLLRPV